MPEVINLLSSTPPPPASQPRQPLASTLPSDPPLSSAPRPLLSDDVESLFAYDDIDKPAKRRRISAEVELPRDVVVQFSTKNLFLFSDDDVALPSDGPSTLKIPAWNEESDPIVFTSPAPVPAARPLTTHKTNPGQTNTITIDDDDSDDADLDLYNDAPPGRDHIEDFSDQLGIPDIDEIMRRARPAKPSGRENSLFSSRTASLLAGLEERSKATGSTGSRTKSRTGRYQTAEERDVLDLEDDLSEVVAESRKPARKASRLTAAEKDARAKEREAAKAQREHDKKLEKERQKKAREEKAREKQLAADLAEVNKLKVDKKESTPEMILDLASSFRETSVGNQSLELMKRLGVEHTFFTSSIPNIVKWRRKVTARYNEAAGHWEPCPHHIRDEDHVLCLVTAQEFVDMVIAPADPVTGTTELELHVARIRKAYPARKPIYLIEGLSAWMRKNQNSRNRAFQAQVRRQLDQQNQNMDDPSSSTRRRKPPAKTAESTPPVDDDTIEDALLELQVTHACLIHHTSAAPESAEWIKNFTEHISTIPYKRERMHANDSAFCMDTGQVKAGEDKADTFVKMLQEVNRVTASMAYGIAARYPSVVDLVRGMRRHGPSMLEDVKKSANKNGALTDSRIGPAASKRLYKVFMGLDPSSTDI